MFEKISPNFMRNPLGIIALFIVMIYAMAGFVTTTATLSPFERLILVIFLTVFPLIVLAVFYMLVTRHSDKLYAPRDFRSDAGYQAARDSTKVDAGKSDSPSARRIKLWVEITPANRLAAQTWLLKNGLSMSVSAFVRAGDEKLQSRMINFLNIPE